MLTWFAQEQPTSCVAACVRMVLTGFGVVWTEEQIRDQYPGLEHDDILACYGYAAALLRGEKVYPLPD